MDWTRILLATANQDKVTEMKDLLADLNISVLSINDIEAHPDVEEDQPTLEGNAIKKAVEFQRMTGIPSLADDTGLQVDALDGAPGVFSARYAGDGATYKKNVDKLLSELSAVPFERRTAHFKSVMALASGDGVETVEGVCEGFILEFCHGDGGFGYDPVFYVPEYKKTFAEMTLDEKNKISHRGLALQKVKAILRDKLGA
jgi:XTP/dITP diphosphohydrolase